MAPSRGPGYDLGVASSHLSGRVVLIFDDDPVLLELLAGTFADVGSIVHTARLLIEAQREVARRPPAFKPRFASPSI